MDEENLHNIHASPLLILGGKPGMAIEPHPDVGFLLEPVYEKGRFLFLPLLDAIRVKTTSADGHTPATA